MDIWDMQWWCLKPVNYKAVETEHTHDPALAHDPCGHHYTTVMFVLYTYLVAVLFNPHCCKGPSFFQQPEDRRPCSRSSSPPRHRLDKPYVTYTIPCHLNLPSCVIVCVCVCVCPWLLRELVTDWWVPEYKRNGEQQAGHPLSSPPSPGPAALFLHDTLKHANTHEYTHRRRAGASWLAC